MKIEKILGIDLGVRCAISLSIYYGFGDSFKYELDKEEPDLQWIHDWANRGAHFVVANACATNATVIALEDLSFKNLRYGKFLQLVSNEIKKAAQDKIKIILINPMNTSRRCRDCGFISIRNRPNSGEAFKCIKCGFEENADVNAAKNIAILCAIKLARKAIKSGLPWKRKFFVLETASVRETCVEDIDWAISKIQERI